MNKSMGSKVFDVCNTILFILIGFITLFPFWNIAVISLNEPLDAMKGGLFFWPRQFTFDCYRYIFESNKDLLHAFLISVLRTSIGTVLNVLCTAMLAYVLARRDFIARKLFIKLFVISMYFNGGLIPFFILMKNLHFINSFWVYIIPPFSAPGLVSAFYLIIMITFIQDIPESFQEAARIDGANDFEIFIKVIVPLCKPVIATIALFVAVGQWSAWQDTFFFASNKHSLSTLQFEMQKILYDGVQQMTASQIHDIPQKARVITPQAIQDSIIVIATVPIIIVYPFLQKYFVSGIAIGGVKE